MDMTASAKKQTEKSMQNQDARPDSRWMDHSAQQRPSVTIFELIDAENVRARKIANAVDANDIDSAKKISEEQAPLATLNELLKIANLPIEVSIKNDEQLFATKNDSAPYSIAELSDGDRNAILIAANVLTANSGSLIIIDEPERHLHRSIVSPLLLSLFEKREDCGFVISTHDVTLPADSPNASTLLIRSCTWNGNTATNWDTDFLTPNSAVPDDVRTAILGARRTVLFIEGTHDSLDKHIYSILYPGISVAPRGNCVEVERAVTGIRGSKDLVWLRAFGLIDRDDRDEPAVTELATRGVFALDCYSVESLYYNTGVMRKIAERQALIADNQANLEAAIQSVIIKSLPHKNRLCERLVTQRARVMVTKNLPTKESLERNPVHRVEIDTTGLIAREELVFDNLVAVGNTDDLLNRYPLRETPALCSIATHLGFVSRNKYEDAVRKLLIEDEEARNAVKQKLGTLTDAIAQ